MNANQQRFWMLADAVHWRFGGDPAGVEYDRRRRSLRLANQRREMSYADTESEALERLQIIPQTRDSMGNRAYWDREKKSIKATGAAAGDVPIYRPAPDLGEPTDMAMGFDGVLYIVLNGQVIMHDRRKRWDDVTVSADGFSAWRIAADPAGGMWVLDRDNAKLGRISGHPLPGRPFSPYASDVFRPCTENTNPPVLSVLDAAAWPEGERPVALDCSLSGRLACLSWADADSAFIRCLDSTARLGSELELLGVRHPFSLRWVSDERIAVLVAGEGKEAPVYRVALRSAAGDARQRTAVGSDFADDQLVAKLLTAGVISSSERDQTRLFFDESIQTAVQLSERLAQIGIEDPGPVLAVWQKARRRRQWPVGDLYPLKKDYSGGPFLHGPDRPPHYPTAEGQPGPEPAVLSILYPLRRSLQQPVVCAHGQRRPAHDMASPLPGRRDTGRLRNQGLAGGFKHRRRIGTHQ